MLTQFMTPPESVGQRLVCSIARYGVHSGHDDNAFVNFTPWLAKRSILGVGMFFPPLYPVSFARTWSGKKNSTFGLADCCAAARETPEEASRERREMGVSIGLWEQLVADVGELFAVRRPRGHVDRALAAEQFHQFADFRLARFAARQRHAAQRDILVRRMVWNPFLERDEHEPLSIRRRVRKPIFVVVARDPLGFRIIGAGAIGRHAPDVPATGAIRVEIDPLPI